MGRKVHHAGSGRSRTGCVVAVMVISVAVMSLRVSNAVAAGEHQESARKSSQQVQRGAAGRPKRIVSLNACTDQLLLALAAPAQIAALTRYAVSPAMSVYRDRARKHRLIGGSAEEVLVLKPDLVLAGTYTRRATRRRLAQFGIRVETFPPARDLDDVRALIARAGDLVGHPRRGAQLTAQIDAALATAQAVGKGITALNLQRRGFVAGAGTLLDDLLRRIGVVNGAAELGIKRVGRTTLEHIIALRPDVLIVSDGVGQPDDQGAALLMHPVLRRVVPQRRWLTLPGRTVICGGPQNVEALKVLTAGFARIAAGITRAR